MSKYVVGAGREQGVEISDAEFRKRIEERMTLKERANIIYTPIVMVLISINIMQLVKNLLADSRISVTKKASRRLQEVINEQREALKYDMDNSMPGAYDELEQVSVAIMHRMQHHIVIQKTQYHNIIINHSQGKDMHNSLSDLLAYIYASKDVLVVSEQYDVEMTKWANAVLKGTGISYDLSAKRLTLQGKMRRCAEEILNVMGMPSNLDNDNIRMGKAAIYGFIKNLDMLEDITTKK